MEHGSEGSARGDPPPDPGGFRQAWAHFLSPERQSSELKHGLDHLGMRLVEAATSLIGPLRMAAIATLAIGVVLAVVVAATIAAAVLMGFGLIPSHLPHLAMIVRILSPAGLFTLFSGGAVLWRGRHRRDPRRRRRGRHRRT